MAGVKGLGLPNVASALRAVTPDDNNDLPGGSAFISVATSGNYSVIAHSDQSAVTLNLAAGMVHPTLVRRVLSTGAASTSGIVAHYR